MGQKNYQQLSPVFKLPYSIREKKTLKSSVFFEHSPTHGTLGFRGVECLGRKRRKDQRNQSDFWRNHLFHEIVCKTLQDCFVQNSSAILNGRKKIKNSVDSRPPYPLPPPLGHLPDNSFFWNSFMCREIHLSGSAISLILKHLGRSGHSLIRIFIYSYIHLFDLSHSCPPPPRRPLADQTSGPADRIKCPG